MDNNIIECTVKWYKQEKGFGFVNNDGIDQDIFLHFSSLDAAGISKVREGDILICEITQTKQGVQVTKIKEIKLCLNNEENPSEWEKPAFLNSLPKAINLRKTETKGEIKWFNVHNEFGFIHDYAGGSDIYFHASKLKEAGYSNIDPGVPVHVTYIETSRGKDAKEISVRPTINYID